jgi:hypothetical protein
MNYSSKLLLNSLYGRFGMDDSFTYSEIISKEKYPLFEDKNKESISDKIDLENNYLLQIKNPINELKTLMDNGFETHNVNISIASATTAHARIHMSQFKDPKFLKAHGLTLFYSDTDSAYFNGPLPNSFVDNTILGAMKLEGIYDQAIFLAPKVYALKNSSTGEEIVKIKGLSKNSINKHNINIELLSSLLSKNSNLEFNQEKWFKHLNKGNISIKDQLYTLKVTGNKRDLIYNQDDILVDTIPLILVNGIIIEHNPPSPSLP